MSNDISRKARMGMMEKVEQGYFAASAPLGYKNNKETKRIEIDSQKAIFMKKAFQLMSTGNFSIQSLVDRLYIEGLRSKSGKKVNKPSLAKYLNNPIYYGWFYWKGQLFRGKHEPIISKELFDSVQRILSNRRTLFRITKNRFPFGSVARCGICNCTILGEIAKKKYLYYHCGFSKGKHEQAAYIKESDMPYLFDEIVKKVKIPSKLSDWILKVIESSDSFESDYRKDRLSILIKEKAKLNNRIDRIYDELIDGNLDSDRLKLKEVEYKNQIGQIESEIKNLTIENSKKIDQANKLLRLCEKIHDLYHSIDDTKKAQILRIIGSNYSLIGRSITVTYNKPFDLLVNLGERIKMRGRRDSNSRPPA
ncbi:MAG: hypothetical protein DWP97_11665 [Calditrichaeota bacterium]|nr:MAG: hypothetical protein DWP97_11665 [Calditrichota bacterium]